MQDPEEKRKYLKKLDLDLCSEEDKFINLMEEYCKSLEQIKGDIEVIEKDLSIMKQDSLVPSDFNFSEYLEKCFKKESWDENRRKLCVRLSDHVRPQLGSQEQYEKSIKSAISKLKGTSDPVKKGNQIKAIIEEKCFGICL